MILLPITSNRVEIPIAQTGCLKAQFDSTYPVHLRGVLSPDEFQESIRNINQAISSRKTLIVCGLIGILCLFVGTALFIAGGVTAVNSSKSGFPVLVGVGIGVSFPGMIAFAAGCIIVQMRLTVRMQRAIANESMKYSTRSPTPCSWRLESSRIVTGAYGNGQAVAIHRIVIEIAYSGVPGSANVPNQFNHVLNEPTSSFPQQNNMFPPPSYYSHSGSGFCSHCGTAQRNPTTNFCSSCGQSLNMSLNIH